MENNTPNAATIKKDIISAELLETINMFLLIIFTSVVSFLGIVFNVFNIVVFVKQGLNDTVNIGLMGLAVSDLCSLVTLGMMCLFRNTLLCEIVRIYEFQHLTAAWPHNTFARISSWITVYVILERCLCVVVPLKIKTIITPRVTISVIVSIFVVLFLTVIPDYATCYIAWKFDGSRNRSVLGLLFLEDREEMAGVSFHISAGTQLGSFGAVVLFTTILVAKVKQKSNWRKSTSSHGQNPAIKENSNRDQKTIKMIILVAVIYCACYLPLLCECAATCFVPEFIIFGPYHNLFMAITSVAFLLDGINANVNIFVYYRMSTRYRTTFNSLFKSKRAILFQ